MEMRTPTSCPLCLGLVSHSCDEHRCKDYDSNFSVTGGKVRERKNRAVSPVIATVVLVAVALTISVAVSFWMSGIAGQYVKLEKVEIQSSVCTWNSTGGFWKIELSLKNTGTSSVSFITAFVNEAEVQNYGVDAMVAGQTSTNMTAATSITSGASAVLNVYIAQGYASLSSATTVNIKIHSAGGMDYITMVQLV